MLRPTLYFRIAPLPQRRQCRRGEHQHNGTIALTQSNFSGVTPTRRVLEVSSARRFHQVIIYYCSLPLREGARCLSPVRGRKLHSLLRGFGEPVQLIKRRASVFFASSQPTPHPQTSIPPSRNRATWRHQSHLIWYVVFQSTSAEAHWASRAAAKTRRRRKEKAKHSLTNGQKPGLEFTDPVRQTLQLHPGVNTQTHTHTATLRAFVPGSRWAGEVWAQHWTVLSFAFFCGMVAGSRRMSVVSIRNVTISLKSKKSNACDAFCLSKLMNHTGSVLCRN